MPGPRAMSAADDRPRCAIAGAEPPPWARRKSGRATGVASAAIRSTKRSASSTSSMSVTSRAKARRRAQVAATLVAILSRHCSMPVLETSTISAFG